MVLGDVIVAVDGEPVQNSGDLALTLEKKQVGEKVKVTVLRDQKPVELQVRLMSAS